MFKRLFENFVLKATDWWFRVKSPERLLINTGFGVIVAIFAGTPLVAVVLRMAFGAVPPEYQSFMRTVDAIQYWILAICTLAIVVGIGVAIKRFFRDAERESQQRVLVVEGRGLRDDDGSPLVDAISGEVPGQRIPIFLDLRRKTDGEPVEPERALDEIAATHRSLLQYKQVHSRRDLLTVYGGLTSVPYTFLTGVLFDDEGSIRTYDWDRVQEVWRPLDGPDDQLAFDVDGLDTARKQKEVVLALGFSYPIVNADLATTFSHSVVRLTLQGMSSDAHWSEQKQRRLAQEFLEVVKKLSEQGIQRIHLVFAAPNSVVFNFGRRYDKRNLPEIVVYQYKKGASPAYPWGVLMPVSGVTRPSVIYSRA
ncbi:MAG: SAVED domain-containing protein [Gammaproteobacteria bacterium]|nr:SAVED domain-containing protein [Gammaproteobacteria bacterium]MDH4351087.1 SAVED domain-containing protein [Gemmatimonadota bacterium]MDH5310278.1 SAVED domain-containing protein [Gammaproteobacteria bacterium]